MASDAGRYGAMALGFVSVGAGLFAIGAPAAAWLALVLGFFAAAEDGAAMETATTVALLGSQAVAILVVLAAPVGLAAGIVAIPLARSQRASIGWGVLGVLLNVAAPLTWILTWASVIGGLLWAFQDFHW